jgi:hypothetical protein
MYEDADLTEKEWFVDTLSDQGQLFSITPLEIYDTFGGDITLRWVVGPLPASVDGYVSVRLRALGENFVWLTETGRFKLAKTFIMGEPPDPPGMTYFDEICLKVWTDRLAAEAAKTGAEAAKAEAETAKAGAETAKAGAEAARDEMAAASETFLDEAKAYIDEQVANHEWPASVAPDGATIVHNSAGALAVASSIANHGGRTDNPHAVTKAQIGLGNVSNFGTATQAQAEAGTDNASYVTPLRVAQAIQKALTSIQITLLADAWAGNRQFISIGGLGITSNSIIWVSPAPDRISAYAQAQICASDHSGEVVTFSCANIPQLDIAVNIVVAK